MSDIMLGFFANEDLFTLYVSVIDTKARVLRLARTLPVESCATLMDEVKRLDEIKEKAQELIWSA